ncbi:protein canopy homolog 3-like [Pollicipes pollicipes]|uniref:protein canopy homolog 3-like n=1 Tax=Pollicipes pollicipes TaxID=41117 RepID=UPI001884C80A|nr:protein canopy homolog 3-like [Pollicipes pollicipes]XP_037083154.1 protein canopy homolog 3-like [Pollicipes pollicipes]XP_037083156.1 protein canopy homolog 3-like [Pollicipes pollicipes]XP_037083157.1 protein canopy homolog 3-like [Pollicipes pollicipes]
MARLPCVLVLVGCMCHLVAASSDTDLAEEKYGVKYASKCEACKIVSAELELQLQKTGRSHDVIQTGYHLDADKSKTTTKYRKSELRLLEVLEDICEGILTYNIHKERTDSTRFAKGRSQTFQTLHNLVDKGVKVDLGIPHELWDKPSAEVTDLKNKCDALIEEYEEVITQWYHQYQEAVPLPAYLCSQHVLAAGEDACLQDGEAPAPAPETPARDEL